MGEVDCPSGIFAGVGAWGEVAHTCKWGAGTQGSFLREATWGPRLGAWLTEGWGRGGRG